MVNHLFEKKKVKKHEILSYCAAATGALTPVLLTRSPPSAFMLLTKF